VAGLAGLEGKLATMRRVANVVQLAGAAVFTVAGFTINETVGLLCASVALVACGYVMERS